MNDRKYLIELGSTMAAYVVLLFGSILLARHLALPQGPALTALILLPMIPLCIAAWVIMRALGRLDELQRRVQLEGLGISVLLTTLVTLGWSFLEGVGYPKFPTFGVWPLIAIGWMGGAAIAKRRFR